MYFIKSIKKVLPNYKQGNLDVRKLPQFLTSGVLPYLGSLLILAIFAKSIPAIAAVFYTSAGR
ncbi:hypothetical protein DP73_05380 [Desulfosporosinus sp. HMP52]|nr:hypothetical protein DP73_05380 [Desulfosporosinus sp. HMP52]